MIVHNEHKYLSIFIIVYYLTISLMQFESKIIFLLQLSILQVTIDGYLKCSESTRKMIKSCKYNCLQSVVTFYKLNGMKYVVFKYISLEFMNFLNYAHLCKLNRIEVAIGTQLTGNKCRVFLIFRKSNFTILNKIHINLD